MIGAAALERSFALVQELYRRSLQGKIDWHESKDAATFEADLGDFILRIMSIPDEDYPHDPDFALQIVDRETGRFVDSITNVTLRPFMDRITPEGQGPYALLREIYDLARRKVHRTDDVLGRVLESLRRT